MNIYSELEVYFSGLEPQQYQALVELLDLTQSSLPGGQWVIKYGIPTLERNKTNVIHFGANKNHIGVYPGPEGINFLKAQNPKIITTKGTWKIPYGQEKIMRPLILILLQWIGQKYD